MADATQTSDDVFLRLSEKEARTLFGVLRFIGGDREKSLRRHTEEIHDELADVLDVEFDVPTPLREQHVEVIDKISGTIRINK